MVTGSSPVSLAAPWWIAVVATAVVVGVLLGWRLRRAGRVAWVANTDDLAQVPAVLRWLRRYRLLRLGLVVAIAGAAAFAGVVAAQPVSVEERARILANRDIVLCLDVSGSMAEYGEQVARVFASLVDSFEGERIALSIFNSTSQTVFPLTDDYELVAAELERARRALRFVYGTEYWEFASGTIGIEDQASLIGDGLASCVLLFDQHDAERSRSIIFSTDNEVWGEPIYTLDQATDVAISRGIVVHGLFGRDASYAGHPEQVEFRVNVERTGGMYFSVGDPGAVPGIVADIQAQQLVDMEAEPERVVVDRNDAWIWWLLVAVLGVVGLAWRVRS